MKLEHVVFYIIKLGCILHVTSNLLQYKHYQAGNMQGCLLATTVRFVPIEGLQFSPTYRNAFPRPIPLVQTLHLKYKSTIAVNTTIQLISSHYPSSHPCRSPNSSPPSSPPPLLPFVPRSVLSNAPLAIEIG